MLEPSLKLKIPGYFVSTLTAFNAVDLKEKVVKKSLMVCVQ